MFEGFPEDTLTFFLDLRFHNTSTWFHGQQERYQQQVRAPFYALIEDLGPLMKSIDPTMEVRPYKVLSRIHRDTRFTKDKSPYRDHLWIHFRREALPREGSLGYFFQYGPTGLMWGMGFWGENREMMDTFRRRLAAKPEETMGIIHGCGLQARGLVMEERSFKRIGLPDSLVTPEQRAWYKLREMWFLRGDVDPALAGRAELKEHIEEDFLALAPVYRLLMGTD